MPIHADRIINDIETIARFSEATPSTGFSRPTFSRAWRKARDYVIAQAQAAGCKVRIDAAGNVHARHQSISWDEKIWLSGSHIDSVPTGGKYDGVVGVVCPLEVLRSAHADGKPLPLELIIFTEEEGTTFGLGMIGSRLWTGAATLDSISAFKNSAGKNYIEAGAAHGVDPTKLQEDSLQPSHYRGLIEIHIEQGPAMWEQRQPLAIVIAIAGRKQYQITFTGTPNHAGSTPMIYRADPLVAAAQVITGVNAMARGLPPHTVATVGRIICQPNAVNVIPGSVQFTVDVRSADPAKLKVCHARLQTLANDAEAQQMSFIITEDQPPIMMDTVVCDALCDPANKRRVNTISGALHDAAILAPHIPTAMLFVASKGGISHNPAEFSRMEDITAAAGVLERVVREG